MTVARLIRSAATLAVVAASSAFAFDAVAQSGYDDSTGQTPTPMSTERGSGASDRSREGGPPADSQGSNIRSGTDTGQDRATPGAGDSSRGGTSSVPNCSVTPPNAAECPPQGR